MTQTIAVPDGSIVWKMGMKWGVLSPDDNGEYQQDNIQYTENPPLGIVDKYFGRGSFQRSFQISGTSPKDTSFYISIGWVKVHILITDGTINTSINSGRDAANTRWNNEPRLRTRGKSNRNNNQSITIVNLPNNSVNDALINSRAKEVTGEALWQFLRSEIYIRDKGICWVCNEFVLLRDYQLGHLVDYCNGGANSLDNCAVMHKQCNNIKPRHNTLDEATVWRMNRPYKS